MLAIQSSMPQSLLFTLIVVLGGMRVTAGPTVVVGKVILKSQRLPVGQLDHALWDELLNKFVSAQGLVDYAGWLSSAEDVKRLDQYVNLLSSADLTAPSDKAAKLAYWINAYNAVTVKGILREYPTSSIRNHTAQLFGYNIWKDLKLQVDDRQVSLDEMEHQLLRKMGEPRIHFAIVCASIGCPRLLNEAYVPERLEEQLVTNTRFFFADESKFRMDAGLQTVSLSPILKWFGSDFGKSQADQLRFIAPYVPENARSAVAAGSARVRFLDYDWNLNDQDSTKR